MTWHYLKVFALPPITQREALVRHLPQRMRALHGLIPHIKRREHGRGGGLMELRLE